MSKASKLVLGLVTVWPLVYIVFFFSLILWSSFVPFSVLIMLHLSTMLIVVILLVIYIRDLFKNDSIRAENKALWAVVLVPAHLAPRDGCRDKRRPVNPVKWG
jgi:hypothetical protein